MVRFNEFFFPIAQARLTLVAQEANGNPSDRKCNQLQPVL
jgi:hypothetical protein